MRGEGAGFYDEWYEIDFFGQYSAILVFQRWYSVYEKRPVFVFGLIFCLVFGNPLAFAVERY